MSVLLSLFYLEVWFNLKEIQHIGLSCEKVKYAIFKCWQGYVKLLDEQIDSKMNLIKKHAVVTFRPFFLK